MNTDHLCRLLEVIYNLSELQDFEQLLQAIVDAACELTASESAYVLRYDSTSDVLSFVAAPPDQRDFLSKVHVPLEGSAAGWASPSTASA